MDSVTPFDAYRIYSALKYHFLQEKYNYFRYNGKINTSHEVFDKRRDKYYFVRLAKKFPKKEDLEYFVVSNLLEGKRWVGDFSEDIYAAFIKRQQSIAYVFSNELDDLFINGSKEAFQCKSGEYPPLILAQMKGKISWETLVVLNRFTSFVETFDRKLGKDDVMWTRIRQNIIKYETFVRYDPVKMKNILKEKVLSLDM